MSDPASVWTPPAAESPAAGPSPRVRRCPNLECAYLLRRGVPAEYRLGVERCSDCGASLSDAADTETAAPAPRAGGGSIARGAVSAVLLLVMLLVARVPLMVTKPSLFDSERQVLARLGMLGVDVVIAAALLVGALFAIAPGLRGARAGEWRSAGRRAAGVAFVATAIALVWGAHLAASLEWATGGIDGTACMLSLAGGTIATAAVAHVISTRGLGSGTSLLCGLAALGSSVLSLAAAAADEQLPMSLMLMALAVVMTRFVIAPPTDAPPTDAPLTDAMLTDAAPTDATQPPAPRYHAALPPAVPAGVGVFVLMEQWRALVGVDPDSSPRVVVMLFEEPVAQVGLALALAALTYRPRAIAALAARATGARPEALTAAARAAVRRALGQSAAFAAGLAVASAIAEHTTGPLPLELAAVLTAVAVDLGREWAARSRLDEPVTVGSLQQLHAVAPVLHALRIAGIDAHARGVNHRALFGVLGPFLPIDVWVPAAKAADARAILARVLGPEPA